MRKRTVDWLLAVAVCFFLAGCAASGMKDVKESGFLGDYSQLQQGGKDRAARVYINPGIDFSKYDKIMFEHFKVQLSDEAEYKTVDPETLSMLTDYYQKAMIKAVEGQLEVVDQQGPGVVRARVAITNLKPASPLANTMSSIIPVGMLVAGATKAVSDDNLGTGEAGSEFELLDSVTGIRLAAAVDRRQGGKGVFRGKWDDTKDAFDYWADLFKKRLAEMRSK